MELSVRWIAVSQALCNCYIIPHFPAWQRPDAPLRFGVTQQVRITAYHPGFRSRQQIAILPLDNAEKRLDGRLEITQDHERPNQRALTLEKRIHSNRSCLRTSDGSGKALYEAYAAMSDEIKQTATNEKEKHAADKLYFYSLQALSGGSNTGSVILPSGEMATISNPGEYRPKTTPSNKTNTHQIRKPSGTASGYGKAGR